MVKFQHVHKDYGDTAALQDVSFSVSPGGIVGLLGPNGAGKTTAMRIMTGFLAPTRGEVFLDGQPFGPDSVEARRRIGYLPESAPLYNEMLAWDYLVYEARLHGIDPAGRVPEVIRQVGLDGHVHKPIGELSKGYRQRVGLAHALLHDPELLVLDEPTSGLDPNQILEVRALIRGIAATKTVILSTHIMQEVEALCDRVLVIHRGRIRYEGTITEFAARSGVGESATPGPVQNLRLLVGGIDAEPLQEILRELPGVRELHILEESQPGGLISLRLTGSADLRPLVFHAATGAATGTGVGAATGAGAATGTGAATGGSAATGKSAAAPRFVIYEMVQEQSSLEDVFHELTRVHEVHHE